jgi:hypothetical protein
MTGTVYRVQDKQGNGAYCRNILYPIGFENEISDMVHRHDVERETHPTPSEDRGLWRPPQHEEKCGFISIASLKQWFSREEIIMLAAAGFQVVKIKNVEITAIGRKQVLFKV